MKKIFLIVFLLLGLYGFSQPIVNRSGNANTVVDYRWGSLYNMFAPRYFDTTAANLQKGIDSCGAIIFCYVTNSLWYRQCAPKKWVQFGSGSGGSQTWQQTLLVSNGSLLTQNNDIDVAGYDFRFSSADEFGVGADSIVNTINNSNGKFRIYGSGNLLTALYSGNVGIGTASPAYTLDVYGKIGINGAQVVYRPDQTSFTGSLFYGNGGTNLSHTSGSTGMYNTGSGIYALDSTTTGYFNTGFGANALKNLTTGNSNTAVGVNALISLKSGTENTAVGLNALYSNTGDYNTGIGYNAMLNNTTGQTNVAVGDNSLLANTTGLQNTSVGYRNLQSNTTGYFNTSLGYRGMESNTIGYGNTAIGLHSLSVQTSGFYNTGAGFYAGNSITTGRGNSFFGVHSGNNALQKVDAVNSFAIGSYSYTTYNNQGVIGSKDSTFNLDLYAKDTARVWVNKTTAAMTALANGNVGIGTTAPVYLLHIQGDIGVRGTLSSGSTIQSYTDAQMFFNTRKGAFRAGIATGTQWDNSNVGELSFAVGAETIASGNQSMAMGSGSSSTGFYSVSIGENNTASGISAQSLGAYSTSSADYSYSYGLGLKSKSFAGVAVGQYNDSTNAASSSTNNPNNRAFEVGIGEDNTTRANALTILHSGNVGIGTTTPAKVFHTVGTVRMESLGTASTDTTTYKPVGINSSGDIIPMTYWPGGGGSSLTATYVGFGGSGNVLSGSANFVFDSTSTELRIGGVLDQGTYQLQMNGPQIFRYGTYGSYALTIKPSGASDPYTPLIAFQATSVNTTASKIGNDYGGIFRIQSGGGRIDFGDFYSGVSVVSIWDYVYNTAGQVMRVRTASSGNVGLQIDGVASQTGALQQFRNSSGTVLSEFTSNGYLKIGGSSIDASAAFEVSSTTKGFLPPRMTATQAEAISSPAEGLLIYSTNGSGATITSKGWWGYDGSTWVKLN